MDPPLSWMLFLLPAIIVVAGLLWYSRSREARLRAAARQYAVGRGLMIHDVKRNTIWTQGRHLGTRLREFNVAQYALGVDTSLGAQWLFLQEWEDKDRRFPGIWRLESKVVEPTEDQLKILNEIASDAQWSEEYLELEYAPGRVSVYWDELGGASGAQKVCGYLFGLAASARRVHEP